MLQRQTICFLVAVLSCVVYATQARAAGGGGGAPSISMSCFVTTAPPPSPPSTLACTFFWLGPIGLLEIAEQNSGVGLQGYTIPLDIAFWIDASIPSTGTNTHWLACTAVTGVWEIRSTGRLTWVGYRGDSSSALLDVSSGRSSAVSQSSPGCTDYF